jgi:hypothetical protein
MLLLLLLLLLVTLCNTAAHLCAAAGNAEASHDLVKAQHGTLGSAQVTQALQIQHKQRTETAVISQAVTKQLATRKDRHAYLWLINCCSPARKFQVLHNLLYRQSNFNWSILDQL